MQNRTIRVGDLVVGSGQVGVFVEYTPLPSARFPTQLEENSVCSVVWTQMDPSNPGAAIELVFAGWNKAQPRR